MTNYKPFIRYVEGEEVNIAVGYDAYTNDDSFMMQFKEKFWFNKEVEHLNRLADKPYTPEVYKVDIERNRIYLTWYNTSLNHMLHFANNIKNVSAPNVGYSFSTLKETLPLDWKEQIKNIIKDLEASGVAKLNLFDFTFYVKDSNIHMMDYFACIFDDEIIMFDDFARLFDKQGKNRFLPFKELNGIFDHKDAYETSKKNNAWRWPEGILNE